jgi:hypothetical protein
MTPPVRSRFSEAAERPSPCITQDDTSFAAQDRARSRHSTIATGETKVLISAIGFGNAQINLPGIICPGRQYREAASTGGLFRSSLSPLRVAERRRRQRASCRQVSTMSANGLKPSSMRDSSPIPRDQHGTIQKFKLREMTKKA